MISIERVAAQHLLMGCLISEVLFRARVLGQLSESRWLSAACVGQTEFVEQNPPKEVSEECRLTFKFGEAFPAENPVAVLIVAMASAFNDLRRTNMRLLANQDRYEGERLYLLRVSFSQLHELRASINYAQKDPRVASFLEGLPKEARRDLVLVKRLNPGHEAWVAKAISYVRHLTTHYGGMRGWEDQKWALGALADVDGEIVSNSLFKGLELRFADLVAVQHLTRKAPEFDDDPNADPDDEVLRARLRTLFDAASVTTTAALRLVDASVRSYLDSLPPSVVTEVSDT